MPSDNDPLADIESRKGSQDTGKASYFMLDGAMKEGATMIEAFFAVSAYYCGMFASMKLDLEEDDDEQSD